MNDESNNKIEFLYKEVSKKQERQDDNFRSIVGKASYLFAFISAFFAVYIGIVFEGKLNMWWNIPCFILTIVILFYLVQVLKIETFKDPPKLDEVYNHQTEEENQESRESDVRNRRQGQNT